MEQHPLSAAFPSMSDGEIAALAEDIKAHGQREPGVIFEGMVLDGWHRFQACAKVGVQFESVEFDPEDDPVAFVKSRNLHRRHLTESQRAAAIVACSEWAPGHRPNAKGGNIAHLTNAEMAREADVSVRTIKDAKAAHAAGFGGAVRDGAISVNKAAALARDPKPTAALPAAREKDRPAFAEGVTAADAHDPDFDPIKELEKSYAEVSALQERIAALTADDMPKELDKQIQLREQAQRAADSAQRTNVEMQQDIKKLRRQVDQVKKAVGKSDWNDCLAVIHELIEYRSAA